MYDKFILKSKTIWGIVIMGIAMIMSIFGVEFNPLEQEELSAKGISAIEAVFAIVGPILAIYGRIVAKAPLSLVPGPLVPGTHNDSTPKPTNWKP